MITDRWTEATHVDALYEGSIVGQETFVEAQIGAAERLLRGLVPRLAERVVSGEVDVVDVQNTVAQAVIRYLRNPGGLTQSSITEGAWTRSNSFAAAAAAQAGTGISFTETELELLRPVVSGPPPGFGVAHQSIPAWRVP